ncbi:glycoside hydrolase superfamily [Boletus edulis]|nr:glycoside hydrolase superfamily [Boletus edulis]
MGAAFDDQLINSVAGIIGMEARVLNNFGHAGLDFFTPNINPFKDPRWGRGQETPGEDTLHLSNYVYNLVVGLQGGLDPSPYYQVVATCKHFVGYDVESWDGNLHFKFNAVITTQDLSEYYLPPFQTCLRDAKAVAAMCSYNAVNGIPSFYSDDAGEIPDSVGIKVTSDCDAVSDIYNSHKYTATPQQGAADALIAVCIHLSFADLGYFDPAEGQPYRSYNWSNVNTPNAQKLAYQAAVEGMVLLKNDGTLPLSGNANYRGAAPYLISPLMGAIKHGYNVKYVMGTSISTTSTDGFAAAVAAAKAADAVIFAGGMDLSVEDEANDRLNITWPGNQLDLIAELQAVGKPLVVAQFGGGQVDDTASKGAASVIIHS